MSITILEMEEFKVAHRFAKIAQEKLRLINTDESSNVLEKLDVALDRLEDITGGV